MNDALGQPQSVLVLGGGSEIARALLVRLTRAERLVLTGRPGSPTVAAAAEEARGRHTEVRTLDMDATDPSSVIGVVDAAPRPGSRGTTVAFLHPKGAFGTLIELVQE